MSCQAHVFNKNGSINSSIVEEDSLEYFQQYLARESVRFSEADPRAQ